MTVIIESSFAPTVGADFFWDSNSVEQAREHACYFHGEQKYGELPYVAHLDAVSNILLEFGYTSSRLHVAAYFHDGIEDTDLTHSWLRMNYGSQVAIIVDHVTDPKGMTRKERKAFVNNRLLEIDESTFLADALLIKMADRLVNVRASMANNQKLFKMYLREMPEFLHAVSRSGKNIALYCALARIWQDS